MVNYFQTRLDFYVSSCSQDSLTSILLNIYQCMYVWLTYIQRILCYLPINHWKNCFKFTASSTYVPFDSYSARDPYILLYHNHSRMPELLLESIYLAGDGEVEEREGLFLRDAAKKSLQSRAVHAAPCMRNSASQLHGKETINCSVV